MLLERSVRPSDPTDLGLSGLVLVSQLVAQLSEEGVLAGGEAGGCAVCRQTLAPVQARVYPVTEGGAVCLGSLKSSCQLQIEKRKKISETTPYVRQCVTYCQVQL